MLAPRQLLPKVDLGSSASPVGMDGNSNGDVKVVKRRCISSACMPCRKRKSKCDGDKPTCTACRDVYSSKCHYDLDADHRRKGALKRDISHLTTKVTSIVAVLDAIRAGSEADVDDIVHLIRSNPDQSHENMAEMIQNMTLNKHAALSIEPPSSLEGQLLMELTGKKKPMDKSNVASHYGHTSNFSLPYEDEKSSMTAEQIETWTTVTSDAGLINDILDSYFSWVHPFYLLFSEEIFRHGMRDKKDKYCTPLLVNAVLAVGCHYSDRPEASMHIPNPIGDRFFTEAKRLLAEDDNTPALTIVQALALMGLRQAMNSYDSSGRRYAAQMMSMVVELGLHVSHSIPPGSKLTASEIENRKITFWGCFVLEQVWSVCVGRIPVLPQTAIRMEKPTLTPSLENNPWAPHGFSEQDRAKLVQSSYKYTILSQCSVLMEIVDDILRAFYAPRHRITARKLEVFHGQLKDWYKALPSGLLLRTDGPTLPQVITLHTLYHNCILMTFQHFIKVSFIHSTETPLEICTSSANTISSLLNLYKQTYGIRKSFFISTHCIMSALVIHLVNISSRPDTVDPQTVIYAADAIRIINEMVDETPIVGRYLKILRELIQSWCKDVPEGVKRAMEDVKLATFGIPQDDPQLTTTHLVGNEKSQSTITILPLRKASPTGSCSTISQTYSAPAMPQQQTLFWTPYPESFEGIPLALPQQDGGNMDITHVLASGVDGDWPSWNRDGFTTGEVGVGGFWG